jgi:Tol biopolymer transport system component
MHVLQDVTPAALATIRWKCIVGPVLSLGSLRLWVAVVSTLALVAGAAASSPANARRTAVGQIAFAVHHGDGDAPWDIYVVRTDGRWVVKKTTKGLDEDDPVWSPDGRHIAFDGWTDHSGDDTSIYTMNPDGTHRRRIARGYAPQWSPDGRRIAYNGSDGVYVMNVDGTGKKRVARGGGPRWSPDGKQLAFTRAYDAYVVDAHGGGGRRLTRTGASDVETWAPGRKIVFTTASDGFYVVNADGSGLRTVRVPYTGSAGWSPDGKLLLYAVAAHGIWTWRLSDGSVRRVTRSSDRGYLDPTWDPDGRKIAFTRNGLPRRRGIWIVNRDGSGAHRIAVAPNSYRFGGPNLYSAPSWDPR